MRDSETYFVDQHPTAAVISAFNSLSFSLINKLMGNSCRVVIISEQTDDWKKETRSIKRNKDLQIIKQGTSGFDQKLDYVVLMDVEQRQEEVGDTALKESGNRIEFAKNLARINSAKSLFVFPYVQWTSQQKALELKMGEILGDSRLDLTVIYLGHLMGPNTNLHQDTPFANMLKDVAMEEFVRVSKKPTNFYPVSVEEVSSQLIKNLFSFGNFKKSVAMVSRPVSLTEFFKLLKKVKADLNFVYDERDWQLSIPKTDVREILTTPPERLIRETLKTLPKPTSKPVFFTPQRTAVSRNKINLQPRREYKEFKPVKVSRKWVFPATLVLATAALTPAILLFLGFTSFGLARKVFVQGNLAATKSLLNLSAITGRLSDGYLLLFSKTREVKALAPAFYFANVLIKAGETGLVVVGIAESSQQFLDKIVGGEIYDPESFAEEISLGLDSLEKELGFFQGEVGASTGLPRRLVERGMNGADVSEVRARLSKAVGVVGALPEILGKDRPTSYLFLLQDETELRPSGGLISAFSLINFGGGRLTDIIVDEVGSADARLKGHVEPPTPIKNYLGESTWFLRDANWDPDFPTAAKEVEWFLDKEIDKTVDGVIAYDFDFVNKLLEETGQLTLRDYADIKVNSQNIYKIVGDFSHDQVGEADFLTALTRELFVHILQLPPKKRAQAARLILKSLDERHLQVFLHESQARESLSGLNWDGTLSSEKCDGNCLSDFLGIVEANVGENKTNYFIERSASLSISLEEGLVKRKLFIFLKNSAKESKAKDFNYRVYLRLLTPQGSGFGPVEIISQEEKVNVTPQVLGVGERKEAGVLVEVAPGQTKGVLFTWEGDSHLNFNVQGEYRLHWRKQAGTGADPVRVEFLFPKRVSVSATPEFSLTNDGSLLYNTTLLRDSVSRIYW